MRTIIAATLLALSTAFSYAGNLDQKTQEMFSPTVQLNDNCSGVMFHSDRDKESGDVETYVLTAKHCLRGKSRGDSSVISVFDYNDRNRKTAETRYVAEVIGKSWKSDLAVIKLRDSDNLFNTLATIAPEDVDLTFGQETHVVGYPLDRSLTYTEGRLGFVEDDAFESVSDSGQFYRATPHVFGGNSGGPMFTEVDGEYQVIGITTGGIRGASHMNYFTPIEEINEYLEKVSKTFDTEYSTGSED